jgi:hypothetical protein
MLRRSKKRWTLVVVVDFQETGFGNINQPELSWYCVQWQTPTTSAKSLKFQYNSVSWSDCMG